jgi:HlyD family secretion protein
MLKINNRKTMTIKMKRINVFVFSLFILVVGCKNNKDQTDAYGNFSATEILVSAETSGRIIDKLIEEGDKIKAGDVTYIIDTIQNSLKRDELIARKNSILAKTSNFNAQVDVLTQQKISLEADLGRFSKMLKDGAATQKQYDDLTNQLEVINKQIGQVKTNFSGISAEVKATEAQIAQINDMISRSVVKSLISGTILETYAEKSENISAGKPLFKIADLEVMDLKAYFSGNQLVSLKTGNKVTVLVDNGKGGFQKMEGIISWISSEAEFTPKIIQTREERVNLVYAVKIRVKNDGTLKINMPGEVKL